MIRPLILISSLALVSIAPFACNTVPASEADRKVLAADVEAAMTRAREKNPNMAKHFSDAYAYAVIPHVGEGALIFGGSYGKGLVYQGGKMIGYCDLSQGSFGAQIGGQSFSEFLFFQDKAALQKLLNGKFAFSAAASAVAADAGAGTAKDYTDGVAVFLTRQEGLMAAAAIGGQQFNYRSAATADVGK